MRKGMQLTKEEQTVILALDNAKLTTRSIVKQINRNQTTIFRFPKNPTKYRMNNSEGRPIKLQEADQCRIIREAKKTGNSANTIRKDLNLIVSKHTVLSTLKENGQLV